MHIRAEGCVRVYKVEGRVRIKAHGRAITQNRSGYNITKGKAEREGENANMSKARSKINGD